MPRHPPRHRFIWAARAACLLVAAHPLSGCDGCNEEPKVPFKLGEEHDASGDTLAHEPPPDESVSYPEAINEPTIDGVRLPIAFARALLAHDLDGDGDRDVLALVHDAAKRMRLLSSMRDEESFGAPLDVSGFSAPGDDTCTLERAELRALGADKAVLGVGLRCGDNQSSVPSSHTVVSLDNPPRVLERFELAPVEAGALQLAISGTDADADGHADVVLELSSGDDAESVLKLAWLDRASGLSRDVREPDATLLAWARAAQSLTAKQAAEALAKAERVIQMDRALCREAGAPLLRVSGAPGFACGARKGAALALGTAALAHAKLKHVRAAFDAFAGLSRVEGKPDAKLQERVLSALAGLGIAKGITLREGPRLQPGRSPAVRLPSARFVDDDTLLLRRREAVTYNLTSSEESAMLLPVDELMRDPAGALCVTDIEQTGCGLGLRIERAPKLGMPYVATAPLASPMLAPLAGELPCNNRGTVRSDHGGFQVLGWAPQGVVAARGGEVVVVPLDIAGQPSGAPFTLAPEVPLPAPLQPGVASADGARYVELTPVGLLVTERDRQAPELWRPDGYAALAPRAREAAISPSGRRAALVVEDTVYILTREGAR